LSRPNWSRKLVVYRLVSDVVSGLLGSFENEGSQTNRLLVYCLRMGIK
jgi:hypothetical protein